MPLKLTKTPAKATVSKEIKSKGEVLSETKEDLEVPMEKSNPIQGQPAMVGIEMSYTHNLGNYQSAKVGVTITLPAMLTEIDEVYEFGHGWAEDRLNGMIAELTAEPE